MGLEVIKAGIADSIQDDGRYGYQHLGVNPNGSMDVKAMQIANALVGNTLNEAVIELRFPASSFHFHKTAFIALSGANFLAILNGIKIPTHQAILVPAGSDLKFSKLISGSYGYLAIRGGFQLKSWLGSKSTNVKANVGGVAGSFLRKGDKIELKTHPHEVHVIQVLPWRANVSIFYSEKKNIRSLVGHELDWLTKKSQADFLKEKFTINPQSDRMGYRLKGVPLKQSKKQELLSTAVTFGTVQLLPNGELILLMADHQTTGGYPRIAHVISADRSALVQCRHNDKITFQWVSREEAEELAVEQANYIKQLQLGCRYKLVEFFKPGI
jgi:antagonist of KipI